MIVPPHDERAEAAVLATLLLDPRHVDAVRDQLPDPDVFYRPANRAVYGSLLRLVTADKPVDLVSIAADLEAHGEFQLVGSPYLAELVDATPALANVESHAEIVSRLHTLRGVIRALEQLLARARDPEARRDIVGFLDSVEAEVHAATLLQRRVETASTMSELMRGSAERMRAEVPVQPFGVLTGFPSIDTLTRGMRKGHVWIVAARPSMGKTSLWLQFLINAARRGEPVLAISLEMDRDELTTRILAQQTGIDSNRLASALLGNRVLNQVEWSRVTEAMAELEKLPMIIEELDQLTPATLRSKMRRASLRIGQVRVVGVDYLQQMSADHPCKSENEELTSICRQLKITAKAFGATMAVCAQLKRIEENKKPRLPALSDLRGSGSIEQDADVVIFVHRDDYYRASEKEHDGTAQLIVAKGRATGTGKRWAKWAAYCQRFTDDEEQQEMNYSPPDDEW